MQFGSRRVERRYHRCDAHLCEAPESAEESASVLAGYGNPGTLDSCLASDVASLLADDPCPRRHRWGLWQASQQLLR